MTDQGITLHILGDVVYLSGVMDEVSNLSVLLKCSEPLRLNFKGVTRLNSTGVRNLLQFLSQWGPKRLEYHECSCELVDQFNMIPALLGSKAHPYEIKSLYVPYECQACSYDQEILEDLGPIEEHVRQGNGLPTRVCPKCSSTFQVISEAYFVFLNG